MKKNFNNLKSNLSKTALLLLLLFCTQSVISTPPQDSSVETDTEVTPYYDVCDWENQ